MTTYRVNALASIVRKGGKWSQVFAGNILHPARPSPGPVPESVLDEADRVPFEDGANPAVAVILRGTLPTVGEALAEELREAGFGAWLQENDDAPTEVHRIYPTPPSLNDALSQIGVLSDRVDALTAAVESLTRLVGNGNGRRSRPGTDQPRSAESPVAASA